MNRQSRRIKALPRSLMKCKVCQEEATAACVKCGGFYCARHGGRSFFGPRCVPCYDGWRPMLIIGAILQVGAGIFILFIPSTLLPGAAATSARQSVFSEPAKANTQQARL